MFWRTKKISGEEAAEKLKAVERKRDLISARLDALVENIKRDDLTREENRTQDKELDEVGKELNRLTKEIKKLSKQTPKKSGL